MEAVFLEFPFYGKVSEDLIHSMVLKTTLLGQQM